MGTLGFPVQREHLLANISFLIPSKMEAKLVLCLLLTLLGVVLAQNCCYPDQFVIKEGTAVGLSENGKGSFLTRSSEIALDAPKKCLAGLISVTQDGKFFFYHVIQDFNRSVEFRIEEKERRCQRLRLRGSMQRCVPDSAKSLGSVYLGDNKLIIETFTYTRHEEDIQGQGTLSVPKGDCIPNSNDFAGRVGETDELSLSGYFNYTKGISDADRLFHVPSFCETQSFSEEPKMYARHDPALFR